jgi:hypothetical protein
VEEDRSFWNEIDSRSNDQHITFTANDGKLFVCLSPDLEKRALYIA